MTPLLQQIAIGAGSALLGFVIATLLTGRRLRRTRDAARDQADGFEGQIAVKRLRIRELEAKLEEARNASVSIEPLGYGRPGSPTAAPHAWLARPADVTPDSAPPRA